MQLLDRPYPKLVGVFVNRKRAQVIIEKMGDLIEDESLRSQFLESAYEKTWEIY